MLLGVWIRMLRSGSAAFLLVKISRRAHSPFEFEQLPKNDTTRINDLWLCVCVYVCFNNIIL